MPRDRLLSLCCVLVFGCEPEIIEDVIEYTTLDRAVDFSGEAQVGGPRLCVAGSNVYAVWHDDRRGGRNQVFFNAGRGGGTSWGTVDMQLSDDPGGDSTAELPAIACAGESVYVVWEDDRDSTIGQKNIYFSWSDDGGRSWSADQAIHFDPEGDYDAVSPEIAVDWTVGSPDKNIYFVWTDDHLGAYDVFAQRAVNGYNFLDEPVRLDGDAAGAAYSGRPRLATDGGGGVYVAWEDSRNGSNDIYLARSRDYGFNWDPSARLDAQEAGNSEAFGVTLAIDRGASPPGVYVAWQDDRSGGKDIFLNYSHDGGDSFLALPTRVDGGGAGASDSFSPSVVAEDGDVVVAWHDAREVGFDILARQSNNGGANWSAELRLDADVTGSAHSLRPRLVRDGDRVGAVWADLRRGRDVVGDPYPDLYMRVSDDGGFTWGDSDLRVDDDPQSTAISEEHQVVLFGPTLHTLWIDYRAGNADLYYRAMPATPITE